VYDFYNINNNNCVHKFPVAVRIMDLQRVPEKKLYPSAFHDKIAKCQPT